MNDTVFPILGSNYLCEQVWFQEFAVKVFRDDESREMLNKFSTMFDENSLTNHGELPYTQVCFKDGFKHFVRQAQLAVLYYEEKQRGKDERASRTNSRNSRKHRNSEYPTTIGGGIKRPGDRRDTK